QLGVSLGSPASLEIEYAQAAVAVGHERAHAQLLGQGKGLPGVGFGQPNIIRLQKEQWPAQGPGSLQPVEPQSWTGGPRASQPTLPLVSLLCPIRRQTPDGK